MGKFEHRRRGQGRAGQGRARVCRLGIVVAGRWGMTVSMVVSVEIRTSIKKKWINNTFVLTIMDGYT
jgi:hypothetical protein